MDFKANTKPLKTRWFHNYTAFPVEVFDDTAALLFTLSGYSANYVQMGPKQLNWLIGEEYIDNDGTLVDEKIIGDPVRLSYTGYDKNVNILANAFHSRLKNWITGVDPANAVLTVASEQYQYFFGSGDPFNVTLPSFIESNVPNQWDIGAGAAITLINATTSAMAVQDLGIGSWSLPSGTSGTFVLTSYTEDWVLLNPPSVAVSTLPAPTFGNWSPEIRYLGGTDHTSTNDCTWTSVLMDGSRQITLSLDLTVTAYDGVGGDETQLVIGSLPFATMIATKAVVGMIAGTLENSTYKATVQGTAITLLGDSSLFGHDAGDNYFCNVVYYAHP
jgi:hypothetical protein